MAQVVIPPEWQEAVAANNAALKAKAEEVETLLQQHDVSGDVTTVACDPYAMSESIAEHAMLSDIALVGGELRDTDTLFRQVVHGVLFQSPIGVLLNDTATTTLNNPNKVFVAWKPQKHASRAVHQALPLLRQAKEVVVGIVDPQMTEFRDGEDPWSRCCQMAYPSRVQCGGPSVSKRWSRDR
ncbi:hypothetical protein GQR58_000252 [Nymphon striatum]|nr:hypothetical protein GQR58_000252 [Nymphon striatum]